LRRQLKRANKKATRGRRHAFSAALADDDAAGGDLLATESFYAETLAITVTAITAAALTFLMSHKPLKFDLFDF
jgi:hypothetical protein